MIKSIDETVPEIYIGSTKDYKGRQYKHKSDCNNPNCRYRNLKLYRFIRSKGGFDNFTFEIIEECEENDKLELEKKYIEMYNPELNTLKLDFDKKEYMKGYMKEYNEKNKDRKKEYMKEYRKDIICCRACRCEIKKARFKRHCKSKKHINNTNSKM
jgi:hypothetical protein